MRNLLRTSLLLSSLFVLSGLASPAGRDSGTGPVGTPASASPVFGDSGTGPVGSPISALLARWDSGTGPVGAVSSPSPVAPGYATSVQVTLNAASQTATIVYLSSSSAYLAVSASITIPAGSTVGYATAYASISAPPTNAIVTATANGMAAYGNVVIE